MQDSALKIYCFQRLDGIRANIIIIIFWPYLEKAKKQLIFQSKLYEKSDSKLLFFSKNMLWVIKRTYLFYQNQMVLFIIQNLFHYDSFLYPKHILWFSDEKNFNKTFWLY